jgi:hypothetical protein
VTDSGAGLRVLPRETFGLNHLLGAAARMTEASELSEVLAVAVEQAADFLGPVGGLLGLLDASRRTIVFAGLQGVPASMMRGNRSVPADADLPMAEALRSGRAVWLSGAAERARRYPGLAARTPEPYACGSVPLPGAGRPLGVLCLTRMREGARQRPFGEAERIFAYTLADLVGAAIAGRAGDRAGIGVYQWDLVSGRLCGNVDMLRLHGRDPAAGAGLGRACRGGPGRAGRGGPTPSKATTRPGSSAAPTASWRT